MKPNNISVHDKYLYFICGYLPFFSRVKIYDKIRKLTIELPYYT